MKNNQHHYQKNIAAPTVMAIAISKFLSSSNMSQKVFILNVLFLFSLSDVTDISLNNLSNPSSFLRMYSLRMHYGFYFDTWNILPSLNDIDFTNLSVVMAVYGKGNSQWK